MITSARRLSLSVMLATLPAALPLSTHALTLGALAGRSSQGQPLDASVELYLAPHERALPMVVTVTPDLFAGNRVSMQQALSGVTARVEHAPDGFSYIHLRSAAPISLPTLNFRVRLAQAERGLSRNYALTLPTPRPAPTGSRGARSVREPARSATPVSGTGYTVRSGDSLWAIAKRWKGPGDLAQRMQALHAANPAAFVGGDINRLKVGAHLELVGTGEAAVAPAAPAARAEPASTADLTASAAALPVARREDELFVASADTTASADLSVTRGRDPVLTARLAELDAKFAAIRARYGEPGTATARAEGAAVPAESPAAPAALPPVATTIPVETADVAPAATADSSPAAADSTPSVAPTAAATAEGRPYLLAGSLVTLAGGIALWVFLRRQRRSKAQLQSAFHAQEAARKAAVAAKLAERGGEHQSDGRVPGGPTAIELESLPDFAATLDGLEPEPKVVPLIRSLEETQDDIDASIAHGRYQDAERLLLQVVTGSPRNVAAKLRLAEVYYITERVEEFTALADDLQLNHRGELNNEDWRRVMRMGKIIAPERPLFAGPRAVNQS